MNSFEIISELYNKKNYDYLEEYFSNSQEAEHLELLAKVYFLKGEIGKASDIYKKLGMNYHYGYCELLSGNAGLTKEIWEPIDEISSAVVAWGKALLSIILSGEKKYPTFFQIRNFLEVDLNNLIKYRQFDYVKSIVNALAVLAQINPESYKYVARIFYNYDNMADSIKLLNKYNDFYYKDPESHVLLARCYLGLGDIKNAKKSLKNCLAFSAEYYPAKQLLEEIS